MTKLSRKLEELFIEMTFAEDRAFNPAHEALSKAAERIEDTFTAIAFAEAGEFETAKTSINKDGEAPKCHRSGYRTKGFSNPCTGRA